MLLHICADCLSTCATRSTENDQPASPSAERVLTPEHPDASPAAPEVPQPMVTDAVVEAAKVAVPEAGTSLAAPWRTPPRLMYR